MSKILRELGRSLDMEHASDAEIAKRYRARQEKRKAIMEASVRATLRSVSVGRCRSYWDAPVYTGDGDSFSVQCQLPVGHLGAHEVESTYGWALRWNTDCKWSRGSQYECFCADPPRARWHHGHWMGAHEWGNVTGHDVWCYGKAGDAPPELKLENEP